MIIGTMASHPEKPRHPLAEVFGFPYNDFSKEANRHRKNRLCPFNNKVPSCTKDKANDPLGVCSVFDSDGIHITCPIRFREGWLIAEHAAEFFFSANSKWTSLTEVRLTDGFGESAGNIDVVLVSYDDNGKIVDFGALEVQAVYISGNVRRPFEAYMKKPEKQCDMDWTQELHYPRPDYLSSSRKRLVPQLIYKGGILQAWKKKSAVALHRAFFTTLPDLTRVPKDEAQIAWMVYDTPFNSKRGVYALELTEIVYTLFHPALERITTAAPGPVEGFVKVLQDKLDGKLSTPPTTRALFEDEEED